MSNTQNSSSPMPPRNRSALALQILGGILVLCAVGFYIRDIQSARRNERAAAALRGVASTAVLGMGLRTSAEETNAEARANLYEPCTPELAQNILSCLAKATAANELPEFKAERDYDFFLFLTNRSRVYLHARRDGESDDLYVSIRELRHTGKADERPQVVEFSPSRVNGLGAVLNNLDTPERTDFRVLPLNAPAGVAYTNLDRVAGKNGFTEADVATTAATLRKIAALDVERFGFRRNLQSDNGDALHFADPEVADSLAGLFAAARDEALPENADGETIFGFVFFKDHHLVVLQMARVGSSDDAYAGFVEVKPAADGQPPSLEVSEPALVPGLGKVVAAAVASIPTARAALDADATIPQNAAEELK